MRSAIVAIALAACASPPTRMTFSMTKAQDFYRDSWAEVGIVLVGEDQDPDVRVTVMFDGYEYGEAHSERSGNEVYISLGNEDPFWRAMAMAHELGHVVLDTDEHTHCGVMGGIDSQLCDEDRELAERRLQELGF